MAQCTVFPFTDTHTCSAKKQNFSGIPVNAMKVLRTLIFNAKLLVPLF